MDRKHPVVSVMHASQRFRQYRTTRESVTLRHINGEPPVWLSVFVRLAFDSFSCLRRHLSFVLYSCWTEQATVNCANIVLDGGVISESIQFGF